MGETHLHADEVRKLWPVVEWEYLDVVAVQGVEERGIGGQPV